MIDEKKLIEELNKTQWQCDYLSKTFHTFSACKISESCRIFEKAKVESQDISKLDLDGAKRLEVAYNTLIKGREQKNG